MRVLLVGNHWTPGPGGAETMLVLTADLLRRTGHQVVPLALAEDDTLPTPAADLLPPPVLSRSRVRQAAAGVWSRAAAAAVREAVRRHRPDVAHVHHVFEGLTLAVLDVLHRHGIPVVVTLHDYRPVCRNYRFLRDRVVAGGLPAQRVRVVPNPVVVPRDAADPHRPPVVCYTGRLVAEKGLHVLLDASRALPPGVRVRVTGSGRLATDLEARLRRERLPVDLLGPARPAEVAHELRRAAVAVLPALWWENCPMAVLEAAAAGVPVVASAVGGIPELVEDGRTGVLVEPGDGVALARALSDLTRDPRRARRLGTAARERVRDRHDPAAHVGAVVSAYRDSVERAASRSSP